jgi:hypothetical protein
VDAEIGGGSCGKRGNLHNCRQFFLGPCGGEPVNFFWSIEQSRITSTQGKPHGSTRRPNSSKSSSQLLLWLLAAGLLACGNAFTFDCRNSTCGGPVEYSVQPLSAVPNIIEQPGFGGDRGCGLAFLGSGNLQLVIDLRDRGITTIVPGGLACWGTAKNWSFESVIGDCHLDGVAVPCYAVFLLDNNPLQVLPTLFPSSAWYFSLRNCSIAAVSTSQFEQFENL